MFQTLNSYCHFMNFINLHLCSIELSDKPWLYLSTWHLCCIEWSDKQWIYQCDNSHLCSIHWFYQRHSSLHISTLVNDLIVTSAHWHEQFVFNVLGKDWEIVVSYNSTVKRRRSTFHNHGEQIFIMCYHSNKCTITLITF